MINYPITFWGPQSTSRTARRVLIIESDEGTMSINLAGNYLYYLLNQFNSDLGNLSISEAGNYFNRYVYEILNDPGNLTISFAGRYYNPSVIIQFYEWTFDRYEYCTVLGNAGRTVGYWSL